MTTTKITPGPWTYELDYETPALVYQLKVCSLGHDHGEKIATVLRPGFPECEANARLIAEAPTMLEIVEAVAEDPCAAGGGQDCGPGFECLACSARLVIERVTGTS